MRRRIHVAKNGKRTCIQVAELQQHIDYLSSSWCNVIFFIKKNGIIFFFIVYR